MKAIAALAAVLTSSRRKSTEVGIHIIFHLIEWKVIDFLSYLIGLIESSALLKLAMGHKHARKKL
jgi:hypothetical protein